MLNWVEISAPAIRNNVAEFRRRLGEKVKLGAVVKSNAYGHGMLEVAAMATASGADWLCVNQVDEGVALRQAGHETPILVMGYVELGRLDDVVQHGLRPVVYNGETVERLEALAAQAGRQVRVHVKVETGTYRQGVLERDLPAFAERIHGSPHLVLEGMTTHFANIEDTTDHSMAEAQVAAFERAQEALAGPAGPVPVRHAACSAAALLFTRTHLELARIGISMYGLWPSKETYVSLLERGKPALDLQPVLTWKTRVAQVKDVPEGAYVGYGCTWRAGRDSRIAVLPVGYFEGYDRGLSGLAHVLVRGRRAPLRGRVCMNMCMVEVTDIPGVGVEDEVVLLGHQGEERIPAEQVAAWCGTISYEVVSRIHPGLPRLVVQAT
ncbi:MAG TPA: alanine racemase [Candidatus Polarisedimenticolaceae bacterium]|nr:alanine racemase [Candidatus Polarisedimenticolaceae bacterium]